MKRLIGKTIKNAKIRGIKGFDDKPYLDLIFTDNSKITIEAEYDCFTGKSEDEYPRFIKIFKYGKEK